MQLLLDSMYPPSIARSLRVLGHDVVACQEHPELRVLDDESLLARAWSEGRTVVTEDAKDFVPLVHARAAQAESRFGVILTSNSSFPRHDDRFIGEIVRALDHLLSRYSGSPPGESVHWLRKATP